MIESICNVAVVVGMISLTVIVLVVVLCNTVDEHDDFFDA